MVWVQGGIKKRQKKVGKIKMNKYFAFDKYWDQNTSLTYLKGF